MKLVESANGLKLCPFINVEPPDRTVTHAVIALGDDPQQIGLSIAEALTRAGAFQSVGIDAIVVIALPGIPMSESVAS